jgi:hypothetical protein
MSYSFTQTASETFTMVHARKLSSKVVSDLVRCSQLYGRPSDESIQNYGEELALHLQKGYVSSYEFGFHKDDKRILTWFYTVDENGAIKDDNRPGAILSGGEVTAASFFNFMTYSSKWSNATASDKEAFLKTLPFIRGSGSPPQDGNGYWETDRNYYAGGVGLGRRTFKPWS